LEKFLQAQALRHLKNIFITIPWFLPAYKAGGPVQSVANMVEQLGGGKWRVASGDLGAVSPESTAHHEPFLFQNILWE
jgi:hypothetical protein